MSLLRTVPLIKVSTGVGTYVNGKWTKGEGVETPFKGTWQPADGRTMELLPEGKRGTETYICYAPLDIPFTVAESETGEESDHILWQGLDFQIVRAEKWNNGLLPHWKLLCVRVKEGEA